MSDRQAVTKEKLGKATALVKKWIQDLKDGKYIECPCGKIHLPENPCGGCGNKITTQ